jgi:hypothetical protein
MSEPTVADNAALRRYELVVDGKVAAHALYELSPGEIVFVHTEVLPGHEGKGLGSTLAEGALDDARSKGVKVVAKCRFIAAYLDRHPEYRDLRRI